MAAVARHASGLRRAVEIAEAAAADLIANADNARRRASRAPRRPATGRGPGRGSARPSLFALPAHVIV
jgi:hypothetical protein